jgi:hypothetical protein
VLPETDGAASEADDVFRKMKAATHVSFRDLHVDGRGRRTEQGHELRMTTLPERHDALVARAFQLQKIV